MCVLRRLGCLLERLGRRPGRVFGSLGRVLGEFRAPLRAFWSVLAYLGASWGRLGLDFRSYDIQIVADHLGCHFLTDIRPILLPNSIPDP